MTQQLRYTLSINCDIIWRDIALVGVYVIDITRFYGPPIWIPQKSYLELTEFVKNRSLQVFTHVTTLLL